MLAFFLLLAIGIYNSRNGEPLDVSDIVRSTPVAERVGMEYPQIDMTEKLAKEEAEAKKKEAEAKKKAAAEQNKEDTEQGKAPAQEDKAGQKGTDDSPASAQEKAAAQKKEATPTSSPIPTNSPAAQAKDKNEQATVVSDDHQGAASAQTATPDASPTPPELQDPASAPDMVYDTSWPPPKDRPRTDSTFLRRIPTMLFFLVVVCALIWISLRIVLPFSGKLTGTANKKKQIILVERQSLGPNRSVVLLQVADKRILVGITEKGMNTLAELPVPTEDEEEKPKDAPADSQEPKKDLVKEVLAQRLSALPLMDLRSKS